MSEGEELRKRIDGAIRDVKRGRGQKYYQKCVLHMNPEAHAIFMEYIDSRATVMGDDGPDMVPPGEIRPYRGMKIMLDESVTWDFHIQHPTQCERIETLEMKVRELERHRDEMAAYLGKIESFMTKLCKSMDEWKL